MTHSVDGRSVLLPETPALQEQNPSDFGGIFHAILLSNPESNPHDIAEELLASCQEIVFQLCSIDDYLELKREFNDFLNQQKVESNEQKIFFFNVLYLTYIEALNASFFRDEFNHLYDHFDSFYSLAQPNNIKLMLRQFRRIDKGKKREYLAQIQTLRPFLDRLYCQKLLMLAKPLTILGEIDKFYFIKLICFFKNVQNQKEWILGASEFNPQLFVSPSAQPKERESTIQENFIPYASQLLEASGELFLENFVPQDFEADMDGHSRTINFWEQAFANEDFGWMELVWALVSEFTVEEKESLLEQLSGHQKTIFSSMDLDESIREPVQNIEKAYMRQLCKEAFHAKMGSLELFDLESLRRYLRE